MIRVDQLYDLTHTIAGEYLSRFTYPWEAVEGIHDLILELGPKLGDDYTEIAPQVWVHKTAEIAPTAYVGEACIIGPYTEVKHCAYVREDSLVGANCVIGNSVELKNVILFDNVQVPHFNYVGDSIFGYKAHMGAGSVTSNVKSDYSLVTVRDGEAAFETGRMKLGAMLGDYAEIGCNSVLNPGTVVGRHSNIYPLSSVRGVVPPECIWKTGGVLVKKEKR